MVASSQGVGPWVPLEIIRSLEGPEPIHSIRVLGFFFFFFGLLETYCILVQIWRRLPSASPRFSGLQGSPNRAQVLQSTGIIKQKGLVTQNIIHGCWLGILMALGTVLSSTVWYHRRISFLKMSTWIQAFPGNRTAS